MIIKLFKKKKSVPVNTVCERVETIKVDLIVECYTLVPSYYDIGTGEFVGEKKENLHIATIPSVYVATSYRHYYDNWIEIYEVDTNTSAFMVCHNTKLRMVDTAYKSAHPNDDCHMYIKYKHISSGKNHD